MNPLRRVILPAPAVLAAAVPAVAVLVAVLAAVLAATGLASTGADAQQKPGWIVVQEDVVKPLAIGAYESAVKSHATAHADGPPCTIVRLSDLRYLTLCDAATLEGAVTLHAMGPVESSSVTVWQHRADLSYLPANPRLGRDEELYVRYDLYYLLPGKDAEAEALTREYRDLDRAIGFPHRWDIYTVALGPDLPLMIQAIPGRSRLELEERKPASDRLRGGRARAINARVTPLLRKIGSFEGVVRRDLSLPPAAPK